MCAHNQYCVTFFVFSLHRWIEHPRTLSFASERVLASIDSLDLNTSRCSTARTLTPREYYQRIIKFYAAQMNADAAQQPNAAAATALTTAATPNTRQQHAASAGAAASATSTHHQMQRNAKGQRTTSARRHALPIAAGQFYPTGARLPHSISAQTNLTPSELHIFKPT